MRKTLLFLILGSLLLVAAGCGSGSGSRNSSTGSTSLKSIAVNSSIQKAIEAYFNVYFDAEKGLSYSKMDSNILEDNENTQLSEAFRETELACKKLFGEGISWYEYEITYIKSSTSGDDTVIELTLDLKKHYSNAPSDLNSALGGVKYSFTLKNNGNGLVVTGVDSDLDEFEFFKTDVEEAMTQDKTLSKAAAIEQVKKNRASKLEQMRGNSFYFKGPESTTDTSTSTNATVTDGESTITDRSDISKSVYVSCKKYTYNGACAADYAQKYYGSKSFFYSTELDCTNFISQCIWAGYIGFRSNVNVSTYENYMSRRIGMAFGEWFAGSGGGSTKWSNVKGLFSYIMDTSKKVGPMGSTDLPSNYNAPQTIAADKLNVGDVVQLWGDNGYGHSIIISRKTDNSYSGLYYCGHTESRLNEPFTRVTRGYRYWRRLTPTTCFLKAE